MLKKNEALVCIHHATYEIIDSQVDKNVEIISSWRVCMAENDFNIKQLLAGRKFGFAGASDAHRANPGLGCAWTGVYAEKLTPEALAEAYRARRLVATQGFPIHIDFRVNGVFIGREFNSSSQKVEIDIEVEAPWKIESLKLKRNQKCIHEWFPGDISLKSRYSDQPAPGEHFYYIEIKLEGDPGYNVDPKENSYITFSKEGKYPHNLCPARGVFAWTSPIWLTI
jgi:hypothetical protein